jgi:uncharacterized protein YjbJ (UPF0337 family)
LFFRWSRADAAAGAEEKRMDQNQVEGVARKAGGRLKDAAGGLTGDTEMQAEGKASQLIGEAQQRYGAAIDSVQSFAEEKPWHTLGIVAGAAFLLGLMLGRR